MDIRIWGLFAVVLFIGGFAGFAKYFSEVDTKQSELAAAQEELKELQERLAENEADSGDAQSKAEKLKQLVAMLEHLETTKQPLVESVLTLDGQKQATLTAFRETVGEVRHKSLGMQWADVPYRNGQVLREVRIQKVSDSEITLAHREGVAKLSNDELPADLKARFRIGMEPFLSLPQSAPAAATAAVGAPPSRGASATAASVTAAPTPASTIQDAIKDIEKEIKSSEEKIKAMEKTMYEWKDRAFAFRNQAESARIQGRPTYNANNQAVQADKQANAVEAQVNALRVENAKLRERLVKALTNAGSRR